MKIVYSRL